MTLHADDYQALRSRYDSMTYRRTGRSGLDLPAVSLGMWHNFGDDVPLDRQRATLRRAFDLGVTHFDLANNYGPPYGSAERNFGTIYAQDFKRYRDELILSTKAGYDMWPGPYGQGGGSRKYVLSSLDQSLARMGVDYVDIFYSHRFDETTPLEETMGALDTAVRQGKALYAGISSYSGPRTQEAVEILRVMGTPLLIHQPSYSMLNRWVEEDLLDVLGDEGVGCIAFSPLAQGMLTDKYLNGVPAGSRASQDKSLSTDLLTEQNLTHIRALNEMAQARGQSLAQMALAWILRDQRVTSVLIGASSVAQLEDSLGSLDNLDFTHRGARQDRPARGRGRHQPLEDARAPTDRWRMPCGRDRASPRSRHRPLRHCCTTCSTVVGRRAVARSEAAPENGAASERGRRHGIRRWFRSSGRPPGDLSRRGSPGRTRGRRDGRRGRRRRCRRTSS